MSFTSAAMSVSALASRIYPAQLCSVAPMPARPAPPPPSLTFTPPHFSADGGTDELPDTINASAAQPGTHILVATAGSGGEGAPVDALLCCQQRRDVLWLWGARTREEKRGCGLAELLLVSEWSSLLPAAATSCHGCWPRASSRPTHSHMPARHAAAHVQGEAQALAGSLPGVIALLSITLPQNATMRRIFARRGFREQCRVITWPATEAAHIPPTTSYCSWSSSEEARAARRQRRAAAAQACWQCCHRLQQW